VIDVAGVIMSLVALLTAVAALQRANRAERRTKTLQIAAKLSRQHAVHPLPSSAEGLHTPSDAGK